MKQKINNTAYFFIGWFANPCTSDRRKWISDPLTVTHYETLLIFWRKHVHDYWRYNTFNYKEAAKWYKKTVEAGGADTNNDGILTAGLSL